MDGKDANHNKANPDSDINIDASRIEGDSVHIGHTINQTINANEVTYKGEIHEDEGFMEMAEKILNLLGRYAKVVMAVTGIGGAGSAYLWVSVVDGHPVWLIVLAIILLFLFAMVAASLQLQSARKCQECGKDFALKESVLPDIRYLKVRDGTRVETTRFFECQYCRATKSKVFPELVPKEQLSDW